MLIMSSNATIIYSLIHSKYLHTEMPTTFLQLLGIWYERDKLLLLWIIQSCGENLTIYKHIIKNLIKDIKIRAT